MILLKNVIVDKYKSIQEAQNINIESDVTTLVGMNEAGKTAFLEAMSKSNYFEDDEKFIFNATLDYPRKELKKYQRAKDQVTVVKSSYEISEELLLKIAHDLGVQVVVENTFKMEYHYDNTRTLIGPFVNEEIYVKKLIEDYDIENDELEKISEIKYLLDLKKLSMTDASENLKELLSDLNEKIFIYENAWDTPLQQYVYHAWLKPNIPKFWYYDEYFNLPSRIDLNALSKTTTINESNKTGRALLEVAGIELHELISATNFEDFIAELEATSNDITDQMFEYWTANNNLEIEFKIDSLDGKKVLDIRVRNQKHRVSIPLNQRSKGFNWFFSFIVWFSKIRNDDNSNYVLLLDEPGLNLHASAQGDLLRFIEDLSKGYQIIYTTHSPFMVDSTKMHRVRTVFEGDSGSRISDSIQEKDQRTLFPLQAALGYELAQNLFVAENNLLVEGPADLLYLTKMSEIFISEGLEGLREDIVIVPVGGLDKIPSFISLMIGNKLNMVALLDSFNGSQGKQRLDDLISKKIISGKKIKFFDEFISNKEKADFEDLFTSGEYLRYFKAAFPDYPTINASDIERNGQILPQINRLIEKPRFNHYLPAKEFLKMDLSKESFGKTTIENFDKLFKTVNSLFD